MINKKKDLSIVIPIFNEEDSIKKLFNQIFNIVEGKYSWELLFINDGSTDNSKKIILDLINQNSNIKLIDSIVNRGKSDSLYQGFQYCSGKIVITMDGDLQDDPSEIDNFIVKINNGYDMVSGWKKDRKDSMSKTLPSRIFNFVLRIISNIKINDFNCGFKAYKDYVAKSIVLYGGLHRFIPIIVKKNGFSISEIIVNHRKRMFGKSKYGNSRLFHGFFDLITVLFLNKYFNRPLHFFGMIGFTFFSIGLIINSYLSYLWIYYNYWFDGITKYSINRPLLFFGILILIVGVQLISVGLIGELFIRYYKKNKNTSYSLHNIVK